MLKFKCSVCGHVYDEAAGIPEKGIAPGTEWKDIPNSFACPVCKAFKSVFGPAEEAVPVQTPASAVSGGYVENIEEFTAGEISAICSSLAKGCEKQRLLDEMEAFNKLADYFKSKAVTEIGKTLEDIAKMLADDMAKGYPAANKIAKDNADRGAQRSLVWSEKVSAMIKSLLERFAKEGGAMLENDKIFVCDICGFIYLGDAAPEICPVCKVQSHKIIPMERR
jgi:rubredoxin